MKQSSGFAVIPAEVLATGNGYAISVYAAIAQHADREGVAWPSVKRIAEITGWSRPTVDKAIDVLIKCGALRKKNRFENGAKLSNQYYLPLHSGRKPANVQIETSLPSMETTLASMETSLPTHVNDVSMGTQPRFHEQEPENKNHEQESSLRSIKGGKEPKPMPRNGMAQTLLATLYEDILRIGPPTSYKTAVGQAQKLADAGCTPLELREIAEWLLQDPFWSRKGITIGTVLSKRDDWRSAKIAEAKKPKKADASGGLVYG